MIKIHWILLSSNMIENCIKIFIFLFFKIFGKLFLHFITVILSMFDIGILSKGLSCQTVDEYIDLKYLK